MNRVLAALLLAGMAGTAGAAPNTITGEWWTPGFNARVRIEPAATRCAGASFGCGTTHPRASSTRRR